MKNENLELAKWSLKFANSAGADDCRVSVNSQRFVEISYRERKPENIKEASTRSLYVEVYVNGRYSGQTTSDMRKDAVESFIKNAVASTKLLAEDKFRTLPNPKLYEGRADVNLALVDSEYNKITPESRHSLAKAIEDVCLTKGGKKVISVTSEVYDSRTENVIASSNGLEGQRESTVYYAGAEMTIQDEGDRRPNGSHFTVSRTKKDLHNPETVGSEVVRRTFDLLGGKKIKTETLPIIVENRVASQVTSGLLAGLYGRNIQQKQSYLADKKGQKIGSDLLTLIDDPHIIGGLGSRLFDGEGIVTKKRTIIEAGVIKEFFVDWYYSRKLGWEPTTGGPSNLIIPPGKRSVKEIMKDLGRGIFITGFIGGNFNSTTGDGSVGIIGHLFENGEPVQAVAEMNIASNYLEFWHRFKEVGNDPYLYSSNRLPSLVFTDVVVSGI
jgi:PmbA protein